MVPFAEIAAFIWIGEQIGILATLMGIVVATLAGIVLLRAQGVSLLLDMQRLAAQGQMPARQIAESVMLALAGLLLVIPGYLTYLPAIALLIPPVRGAIFAWLSRRMVVVETYARPSARSTPGMIELDAEDYRDR